MIEGALVPDARTPRGAPRRTRWPSLLDVGNPRAVVNLGANKALERVARRMRVDPRLPSALRRASRVGPSDSAARRCCIRSIPWARSSTSPGSSEPPTWSTHPGSTRGGGTGDDLPRRAKLLRDDRIEEDERAGVRDDAPQRHRDGHRRDSGRPIILDRRREPAVREDADGLEHGLDSFPGRHGALRRLLLAGKLHLDEIITQRIRLDRNNEAFDAM